MFKYSFWRNILNMVYWLEWWTARSVNGVEAKFFKAQVDYHEGDYGWNEALVYLENDEDFEDDEEL